MEERICEKEMFWGWNDSVMDWKMLRVVTYEDKTGELTWSQRRLDESGILAECALREKTYIIQNYNWQYSIQVL